jgi:hypothetical protein
MTKNTFKIAFTGILIAVFTTVSMAQANLSLDFDQKKKKKKKDDSFKEHLWYGAGLGLGFSAFNGQSSFGIGISPMVGYKIIPRISVGPRVSFFYTAQNLVDTEIGAFLRIHAFRGFFLQGELGQGWDQELYLDNTGDVVKDTEVALNPYFGLGYNFSRGQGGPGQEIALMYNFRIANDVFTNQQPIQYRLAFTLGF